MGRLCLLAVFLLLQRAESLTWEFGKDDKQLVEISQLSGRIKAKEKVKKIDVPLQPCTEAMYVFVDVFNDKSSPAVAYDLEKSVLTISYSNAQQSLSRYDVLVKGKKKQNCDGNDGGNNRGHLTLSGSKLVSFLAAKNKDSKSKRHTHGGQHQLAGPSGPKFSYLNIGKPAVGYRPNAPKRKG